MEFQFRFIVYTNVHKGSKLYLQFLKEAAFVYLLGKCELSCV
jgi:hypothetical protein